MIKKVILEGSEARAKLLKGASLVGRLVGRTLGPKGRNAIMYQAYSAPTITNDGVSTARKITLDDEIEDLGAQIVVEAAMKTNERAGDGTTTCTVIASKLIEDCAQKIAEKDNLARTSGFDNGADVVGMSRSIIEAKDLVIEKLKTAAKPVKKGDIKNIIATSLGKIYPEYVDALTEMVEKVGKDGYISTEDNWGTRYGVETTTIEGMRFLGSYCSQFMMTNLKSKEAVWEDTPILVCNYRLDAINPVIDTLLKEMLDRGIRKLVIIAEGFSGPLIKTLAATTLAAREGDTRLIQFLGIKAPSLTTDQFNDIVAVTGGKFFDKNLASADIKFARLSLLGYAKKVVVDENDTIIIGGAGNPKVRIEQLQAEVENEKDSAFKEQTKRRIGALASGFGIIRVGAATEPERKYVKLKIEDAVNAAKAALEEGIVRGGGLALKEIAEELGKDNILYEALNAPHNKIKSNCGGELKVPQTVVDPVKVTRLAVENACSVASQLITAEVAIAERRKTLWDDLDAKLAPRDNEDFRDEENNEIAYRT